MHAGGLGTPLAPSTRPGSLGAVAPVAAGVAHPHRAVRIGTAPAPTSAGPDALLASANLLNGTFAPGFHVAPQGLSPESSVLDPSKGEVFVADYSSNRVSVFDAALDRLVATIPTGTAPTALAYDAAGGEIFVANYGSNNISVINDTTLTEVASIPVGAQSGYTASAPNALVYSPSDKAVFVAEMGHYILPCCTYNVTELSGLSNTVIRVIQAGAGPFAEAYYPTSDLVYVLNYEGYSLSVVNAATGGVANTYYFPDLPLDIAVDASDGVLGVVFDYFYGYNLSEYSLSGTSLNFLRSVPLPGTPQYFGSMAYDPQAGEFVVAMDGRSYVGVTPLSGVVTQYGTSGACLSSVGYFPGGPALLATDACANRVYALDPTTLQPLPGIRTGVKPTAVAFDPGNGDVYFADGSGNTVTVLNASTLAFVQRIDVGTGPSSFAYDAPQATMYVLCDDGSGNASVEAIFDATLGVTATIRMPQPAFFANADTITFDDATNRLYVAGVTSAAYDDSNENLTVLDPTTHSVVGNLTVTIFSGGSLGGGYYDRASLLPLSGTTAAVSDPWEGRVFGMDLSSGSRLWTAVTGGTPTFLALDPQSQKIDVVLSGSSQVAVVDPTAGTSGSPITFPHPVYDLAYDPGNLRWYASEPTATAGYVSSLDGTTHDALSTVPLNATTAGIAYLPSSGEIALGAPSSSSAYFIGSALEAAPATFSPTAVYQDEPFAVAVSASQGYPPYSFAYSGLPEGCASANTSTLTCDPPAAGNLTVSVRVSDLAGESSVQPLAIRVLPYPLNVSIGIAGNETTPLNGTSVELTATLTSAESAQVGSLVNFTWAVAPAHLATLNRTTGGSVSVAFPTVANVTVTLTADLNGTLNRTSAVFHVHAAPPTPVGGTNTSSGGGTSGLPPWLYLVIVGAVAAAAVVAVVLARRSRNRAADAPTEDGEGPAEPGEAAVEATDGYPEPPEEPPSA